MTNGHYIFFVLRVAGSSTIVISQCLFSFCLYISSNLSLSWFVESYIHTHIYIYNTILYFFSCPSSLTPLSSLSRILASVWGVGSLLYSMTTMGQCLFHNCHDVTAILWNVY